MSTRGAVGFRVDSVDRIAYNHFDSYPEGLGFDLLQFLRGVGDWNELSAKVRALRVVTKDEAPSEADRQNLRRFADLSVGNKSLGDWYCLLRDTQGNLAKILEAGVLIDGSAFLQDSLFCEWAYVVNLDAMTLECYRGFQTAPHLLGRYATRCGRNGYYPCALATQFSLHALPSDDHFVATLEPDEEAA